MELTPKERLHRVLAVPERRRGLSTAIKTAVLFAVLALAVAAIALIDPRPSLRHVRVTMLSGSATGNYFAIVEKLGDEVARRKGRVANVTSAGSVENIRRLIDVRSSCTAHFALVQDGVDWPEKHGLELVGRLPHPESLVVLGRNADAIVAIAQLKGLRVGIGPVGSGTENLMRRVLAPLGELELTVLTQPIDDQLAMLERGELDLGAMVIDDEAKLLADAVAKRGLQILSLPDAASLARRFPFARVGTIEPGHVDYVHKLPPRPKSVLHVDTLVVGNGCASHSQTQGLMSAIAEAYPTFVRHNKGDPNLTGIPLAPAARSFFDDGGPDLVGEHFPWVVDVLPTATWVKIFLGFSVLFSGMRVAHRFRLWRIDAERVGVERDVQALFGRGLTVGDLAAMPVDADGVAPGTRERVDAVIARLTQLSERCRKQSLSVIVPMGEEMAYRYQEGLIADTLQALRAVRERLVP